MKCPSCQTSDLVGAELQKHRVMVDVCPACKGVWFDADELNRVLSTAASHLEVPKDAEASRRRCPRCSRPLYTFRYPQTLAKIDMCKACHGLWFDPGEFTEVKLVRQQLKKSGELQKEPPVPGVKGALLKLIEESIASLKPW
ncbi:MAG TPA: zf-TFIIB domain-containing protein [Planctomycetota bacterium]|nr:zf-TFIIB domain-containing protein [Planctomycetota bacterium]